MENRGDQSHRRPLCEAGIAGVVLAGFVAWQYFQFSQIERSTDYTAIFRPILQFFFETLRGGEIPLWNPYIGLGRPILTDIHLGFLYPPTYLLALGERLGLFLLIWLHYLLLCLGTSGLARHFGARQPWALLAGLVVCVAGNYNGRMLSGMIYYVFQQCYAPLLLLLTCRLGATWDWRRVIRLGAVTTAMFLCGNANVFYLIELGLAVYLGAFAWFEFKTYRWRGTGVLFGQFAAALIVAIALSSFAWQPYLDLVENGNRARSDFDFSAFFSADALHLYGIVAAIPDNWELNFHQGYLWTLACAVALVRPHSAAMRATVILILFSIVYSLGANTPAFGFFYDTLPGVSLFRIPPRIMLWPAVLIPAAGAVMLSRQHPEGETRRWLMILTVGLLLFHGALKLDPANTWPTSVDLYFLAAAFAALLLAGSNRLLQNTRARFALIAALTLCELLPPAWRMQGDYIPTDASGTDNTPLIAHLSQSGRQAIAIKSPPPRYLIPSSHIPQNEFTALRAGGIGADTPLFQRRPWNYLHAAAGIKPDGTINHGLPPEIFKTPPAAFRLLSIDFALDLNTLGLIAPYRPLPRARFVNHFYLAANESEALQNSVSLSGTEKVVIVEQPPDELPDDSANSSDSDAVSITSFRNNRIEISVTNSANGYLVLNEAWFPGWVAYRGNTRIVSEPVNYWMRGFRLPPGNEPVDIRFEPRNLNTGIAVAAAALALSIAGLVSRRYRRAEPGQMLATS